MAEPKAPSVDPKSGYCRETMTFRSLRPPVPLPPESLPISFTSFALSLLPSPLPSDPALLDASTGHSLSYPDLLARLRSLASAFRRQFGLRRGDVAFIMSPSSVDVPVLYLALLSLGVVVCPANPISTPAEISRQCALVSPVSIVFTVAAAASKLPPDLTARVVLLDSPEFRSLLFATADSTIVDNKVTVRQTDAAAILFSSGTTGRTKAAALSHRSFIAVTAGFRSRPRPAGPPEVGLLMAPMFHSLGFSCSLQTPATGGTLVVMRTPGLVAMLAAVERYGVTTVGVAPPTVVTMAGSEEVAKYELRSLQEVITGGGPLPVDTARRFEARFPNVLLRQGYGSTEGGSISIMIDKDECNHFRSMGRLSQNVEAKIVDVVTGKTLSTNEQGELWIRGPAIMIGYVGDDEANASTFDSEGWLKTGDLCYFDGEGFLYIVDRLKEMIKYKAYQVPPAELEHLLLSLPNVVDAAVVPYPQEDVGEIPMAFVVKKPGSSLSEVQVMDHVAKQVAPYKKIHKVAFVDSIPKSASGKVLRRELASHAIRTSRL